MKKQLEFLSARIPFNKPYLTGLEEKYIKESIKSGWFAGNGFFTQKCHKWLEKKFDCEKILLTTSCTTALEMIAILSEVKSGDEVIMPSFTFVSTANAFVLRGATPVFVDIRSDTLNIDEKLVEEAITKKTKAIVAVHYAGVGCEMDKLSQISKKHRLLLIEDAAQGFLARFKGKYLGTIGDMGAFSFHETKNVISGEGGAILVNKKDFVERSEIIWEKGTNRNKYLRGEIDKYTWVDIGSSYLPADYVSAFLWPQLLKSTKIMERRVYNWMLYHENLKGLEKKGYVRRPIIPSYCEHNGHLYYILVDNLNIRDRLLKYLKTRGILATFHYVPLHSSPAGKRFGKTYGNMKKTQKTFETLIRLPLFFGITNKEIEHTTNLIYKFFKK